jgi:hypothetical protein
MNIPMKDALSEGCDVIRLCSLVHMPEGRSRRGLDPDRASWPEELEAPTPMPP